MRRKCSARQKLSVLVIVAYAHCAIAGTLPDYFNECMTVEGSQYLEAVSTLMRQTNSMTFLKNVANLPTASQKEKRLAEILMTRNERPSLFSELAKAVKDARENPNYGRGGFFEGCLINFTSVGPESKYVWEKTEDGLRKVEKMTGEEVQSGMARNAAARLALVEYFLKLSQDLNDYYEMPGLLSALKVLEDGRGWMGKTKRPELGIPTADLIEDVYKDDKRPVAVRVAAAVLLPEGRLDKTIVAGLMIKALEDEGLDDDRKYRRTAERAAAYLRLYGDQQALAALKANEPKARWKHELVGKTVSEMSARIGDKCLDEAH